MSFHAFMSVTIGRSHELEGGMAGKDPVRYQRMPVAEEHGRQVPRGEEAAWGGYLTTLELFADKVIPRFR